MSGATLNNRNSRHPANCARELGYIFLMEIPMFCTTSSSSAYLTTNWTIPLYMRTGNAIHVLLCLYFSFLISIMLKIRNNLDKAWVTSGKCIVYVRPKLIIRTLVVFLLIKDIQTINGRDIWHFCCRRNTDNYFRIERIFCIVYNLAKRT